MHDAVIETRALRKRFGSNLAVADLSLSIGPGEVFGFLGPNGAGKTTSLKLLLGLVEPSSGSGRVLGAPLGERRARERIGFLPEHFRFHDCLRGRELLRMHGRLHGLRGPRLEARIEELLDRVRLTEAADRPIRTYSKGMLQRIGLAQALINSPELVFLDEPTSGLDPLGRVLVRNIIEELRAAGTTVFLNSHLLGEVEATCDRVVFVKRGRVVHELALAGGGEPSAALDVELRLDRTDSAVLEGIARFGRDVRCEQCARELGVREHSVREQGVREQGIREQSVHAENVRDQGVHAQGVVRLSVDSERVLPDLARWLVEAGVGIYELRSRRKSLEEWFLEVMGADQAPG